MTYEEFSNHFVLLHPQPDKPNIIFYLLRIDLILLTLAALGGVIFSASRTFTLIAEQSGSSIAAFAVLALEFSLAGLILSEARKNNAWVVRAMRASAVWVTIVLLLLILVVTNASYEIKQVNLMVPEQILQWVLVFFLGVLIPILVVINLENLSTRIPEYLDEYKQNKAQYYVDLTAWNKELADAWKDERRKEFSEETPMTVYTKQERREFIQEQLTRGEQINKSKLAEKFGVSTTTIINDIKELAPTKSTDEVESQF